MRSGSPWRPTQFHVRRACLVLVAFASAWLNNRWGVPVFWAIPLAGLMTTIVGMLFGIPAARIKGLYLAIATFAAQFILEDFFARAGWFTGGSSGTIAQPFSLFGWQISGDRQYFYVVLAWLVVLYLVGANLLRSRDGRAFVGESCDEQQRHGEEGAEADEQ